MPKSPAKFETMPVGGLDFYYPSNGIYERAIEAKLERIKTTGMKKFNWRREQDQKNGLAPTRMELSMADESYLLALDKLHKVHSEYRDTKIDAWFNDSTLFNPEDMFEAVQPSLYDLPGLNWMSQRAKDRIADEASILLSRLFCLNRINEEIDIDTNRVLVNDLIDRILIVNTALVQSGAKREGGDRSGLSTDDLLKRAWEWNSELVGVMEKEEMNEKEGGEDGKKEEGKGRRNVTGAEDEDQEGDRKILSPRYNEVLSQFGQPDVKEQDEQARLRGPAAPAHQLTVSSILRGKVHPPQTPEKGGQRKKGRVEKDQRGNSGNLKRDDDDPFL